jgi:hypothetical protein
LARSAYHEKLAAPGSRLRKLIAQGSSDQEIVESFYLGAYARVPGKAELETMGKLIASRTDREEARRDFVWAILCSREFAENR